MAQHDYNLANQNGAAFRADLNSALEAVQSQNSGATEPVSTVAYMPWADTNAGMWKVRNAADSAWVSVMSLTASRVDTAAGTSYDNASSGLAATNVKDAIDEIVESPSSSLRENIKVTVGAGGDFPTINAAVLHLSRFTPDIGVTAEVELVSGFVMMEQLFVEGLDLGWITITGVDAETVINEPSLTRGLTLFLSSHKPAFGVINGTLPTIGQLFSFSSKGSTDDFRSGVLAYNLGRADILDGCGVRNAGFNGIYATDRSSINARGAIVSGAGNYSVQATQGSTINALGADASGAGAIGINSSVASTINAANADASGAGANGINATQGSTINADGADASGAGTVGIGVFNGSTINARGATGTLSQAKNTVTNNGIIFQP